MRPQTSTAVVILLMLALPLVGTSAFMLIEGWGFLDSLYMSVITLSTVGYQEVHPLSKPGQVFVIFYLIGGLVVFFFGITHLGETVLKGEMRRFLGRRQMSLAKKTLRDHYVVCGCGRLGRSLCEQLAQQRKPFVVIDRDEDVLQAASLEGWNCMSGDATDDRILETAGIDHALGLAAVLPSDADNLYVVMSARLLRKDLTIISRATDDKSVAKLHRAGANRVICLYKTGAVKLAQLLSDPELED